MVKTFKMRINRINKELKCNSTYLNKTNIVMLLVVVSVFSISCKKEKRRICDLYSNDVGYAIGTIQSYTSVPLKVTYKYGYTVDGTDYSGNEKVYGIGQKDENLINRQFLVIYAIDDESNSDLNTNYMIESEQDFNDFKSEFISGPPSPDFPNHCK